MPLNIDFIGKDKVQGAIASYMMSEGKLDPGSKRPFIENGKAYMAIYKGGDPNDLKNYAVVPTTNATLRRDEWKQLDEAVLRASEQRLGGFQDLSANGLVYNLGNGMGTTVLEYHDVVGDLTAELTMDGISRGENNRPDYQTVYLPIPILHVDYEINMRELSVSRNLGQALDTYQAERATRAINLKLDQMLYTNLSYTYGSGTIYSYVNHPNRNQLTVATGWAASAKSPKQIVQDVLDAKAQSLADYHFGPWMLYIPANWEIVMDYDYEDTGNTATRQTIRERIMAIGGIKGIKVIDILADDEALLVQMTSDVVRVVRGMGIQNIQWKEEGDFVNKFKVITIQVPQVRSDPNGRSGIVHMAASFS